MDANILMTLVSSLGFPVVACMACAWYINKQSDRHREEIDKITEAVNNNTLALTRLVERLGDDENKNN